MKLLENHMVQNVKCTYMYINNKDLNRYKPTTMNTCNRCVSKNQNI